MYSDRELLALAAKARGGIEVDEDFGLIDPEKYTATQAWRPLTDDGDALRLAVKLSIHIRLWVYSCEAEDNNGRSTGMIHASDCGGDVNAATRRAIVRAAAAIGEAMQ